jgi:hypothetical protein
MVSTGMPSGLDNYLIRNMDNPPRWNVIKQKILNLKCISTDNLGRI